MIINASPWFSNAIWVSIALPSGVFMLLFFRVDSRAWVDRRIPASRGITSFLHHHVPKREVCICLSNGIQQRPCPIKIGEKMCWRSARRHRCSDGAILRCAGILTKMIILKRATNACLQNCAIEANSPKKRNLNFTQLFYAWLQILKRDLHGNEDWRRKRNICLIFWGGNINVLQKKKGKQRKKEKGKN